MKSFCSLLIFTWPALALTKHSVSPYCVRFSLFVTIDKVIQNLYSHFLPGPVLQFSVPWVFLFFSCVLFIAFLFQYMPCLRMLGFIFLCITQAIINHTKANCPTITKMSSQSRYEDGTQSCLVRFVYFPPTILIVCTIASPKCRTAVTTCFLWRSRRSALSLPVCYFFIIPEGSCPQGAWEELRTAVRYPTLTRMGWKY